MSENKEEQLKKVPVEQKVKLDPKSKTDVQSKDYYFDSYSHFGIHEEMLKDKSRTRTYMNSILNSPELFKDKIVLDVGCGTGILSMFAAKAGAKHVYGVDCANIVIQARDIIKENGLDDKITIIQGKIEEIKLPIDEETGNELKVDIIISEWMGYMLLYESMLDSVIYARDKWLNKDGLLFPDYATLYIAAFSDDEYRYDKIDYWNDVYGFKMSCIKGLSLVEPLVDTFNKDHIISKKCPIFTLDLYKATVKDLESITREFKLDFICNEECDGLITWFDVEFSKCQPKRYLSTAPHQGYTHWRQTVFFTEKSFPTQENSTLSGVFTVSKNEHNPRDLDIKLDLDYQDEGYKYSKIYKLR